MPLPEGAHYVPTGERVNYRGRSQVAKRASIVRLSDGRLVSNRTAQNIGNAERGLPSLARMNRIRKETRRRIHVTRAGPDGTKAGAWSYAIFSGDDVDAPNVFIRSLNRDTRIMIRVHGSFYPGKPPQWITIGGVRAQRFVENYQISEAEIPSGTNSIGVWFKR